MSGEIGDGIWHRRCLFTAANKPEPLFSFPVCGRNILLLLPRSGVSSLDPRPFTDHSHLNPLPIQHFNLRLLSVFPPSSANLHHFPTLLPPSITGDKRQRNSRLSFTLTKTHTKIAPLPPHSPPSSARKQSLDSELDISIKQ